VLEVDGKRKIAQCSAICRFLAKRYNLTGADEFEFAKCDELVDAVKDLGNGTLHIISIKY
jgi:glutathione S-transferase